MLANTSLSHFISGLNNKNTFNCKREVQAQDCQDKIMFPPFSRCILSNGCLEPIIRAGEENKINYDGNIVTTSEKPIRVKSPRDSSISVRSALNFDEFSTVPLLSDLMDPQKMHMTQSINNIICGDNGGILPFSVYKFKLSDKSINVLSVFQLNSKLTPSNIELAYWLPQGKYIDIPVFPRDGDPEILFAPAFSGCSLIVDQISHDSIRVYHVQGGRESQEYNNSNIFHGHGLG